MLARNTPLRHPLGVPIQTPLLIPSFSSKGFGFVQRPSESGPSEVSEAADILDAASEFLTEAMLLSAYDIYHGHLPQPQSAITEIVVVDSGGYETSDVQDLSGVFAHPVNPKPWDRDKHKSVLAAWPKHIPAIFVSYDEAAVRLSLLEQIELARDLFGPHRDQLSAILLKPETKEQFYLQVDNVVAHARHLGEFSVIGVTEKELGNSFLKRMVNIARIRTALDEASIAAPIHVFGGLDPISVPLYFLAGAQIFDGLTWLRFGYDDGYAVYRHNYAAKRIGIDRRDDFIKVKSMQDNIGALADLGNLMQRFLIDYDYAKFGPNEQLFRDAVELLQTRFRRAA